MNIRTLILFKLSKRDNLFRNTFCISWNLGKKVFLSEKLIKSQIYNKVKNQTKPMGL